MFHFVVTHIVSEVVSWSSWWQMLLENGGTKGHERAALNPFKDRLFHHLLLIHKPQYYIHFRKPGFKRRQAPQLLIPPT